jgi:hypothetical protein
MAPSPLSVCGAGALGAAGDAARARTVRSGPPGDPLRGVLGPVTPVLSTGLAAQQCVWASGGSPSPPGPGSPWAEPREGEEPHRWPGRRCRALGRCTGAERVRVLAAWIRRANCCSFRRLLRTCRSASRRMICWEVGALARGGCAPWAAILLVIFSNAARRALSERETAGVGFGWVVTWLLFGRHRRQTGQSSARRSSPERARVPLGDLRARVCGCCREELLIVF